MWYSKVVADLSNIPDFIAHFESELTDAKRDCKIGGVVEKRIPSRRYGSLQEGSWSVPEHRQPKTACAQFPLTS